MSNICSQMMIGSQIGIISIGHVSGAMCGNQIIEVNMYFHALAAAFDGMCVKNVDLNAFDLHFVTSHNEIDTFTCSLVNFWICK